MNLGFMVAGIFMANLIAPAYALSLKLSPEVISWLWMERLVSRANFKGRRQSGVRCRAASDIISDKQTPSAGDRGLSLPADHCRL